jgi:hypothetical protein
LSVPEEQILPVLEKKLSFRSTSLPERISSPERMFQIQISALPDNNFPRLGQSCQNGSKGCQNGYRKIREYGRTLLATPSRICSMPVSEKRILSVLEKTTSLPERSGRVFPIHIAPLPQKNAPPSHKISLEKAPAGLRRSKPTTPDTEP